MALEPRVVEPSCVAASGISEELSALHSRVLDTLPEARAPFTRCLYALKHRVFVKWCGQAHIASFRSPQGGQSIGRHVLVLCCLKGARGLHCPRPPAVPPWGLEVVFRDLSQTLFEPVTSVDLKELAFKTALLLCLRVG